MNKSYHLIIWWGFLILYLGISFQGMAQDLTTFIIIRHAEKKLDGTDDPSLTERGKKRANLLAYLLNSQPLEAIYTTQYSRNTSTIYPTAQLKGVITKIYDPEKEEEFLKELLKKYKGKTVLICGHSDTVPKMVNLLIGERRYPDLKPDDHDDIFIVTITEMGHGKVTIINY